MREETSVRNKGAPAMTRHLSLRRGGISALAAIVTITTSLALATGAARADGSPSPAATFPLAGETAPPAEAIPNPSVCSGWYRQSNYGGVWPMESTWWEYNCSSTWPQSGGGATNADWGGEYTWINYFYWDGSKPVHYGEWFWDGYFDSMLSASYCWYWNGEDAGEGNGPFFCSF